MDKSLEEKWEHLQTILNKRSKPKEDIQYLISAFIDLLQNFTGTESRAEYELVRYIEDNLKLIRDQGSKAAFQAKRGPKSSVTNEIIDTIRSSSIQFDLYDSQGRVIDEQTGAVVEKPEIGQYERFRKRVKNFILTNYADNFSHLDDRQISNVLDILTGRKQ